MKPGFRVVPSSPFQRSADRAAPLLLYFERDGERLALATSAIGIGIDLSGAGARVMASRVEAKAFAEELARRGSPFAGELRRFLDPVRAWKLRTREFVLTRPVIMGILNLTGDSFSGDGVGHTVGAALRHAEALHEAGADIIDVGGETARADRPVVDPEEEAKLVSPVIAALVKAGYCVSNDTYKPLVARAALESGAEVVNDISGLTLGAGAAEEAARAGAGYVLNYSYSVPKRRPDSPPRYEDVVLETLAWMEERLVKLRAIGFDDGQICIDPGIAFGKSHDEDLQVLRRLSELMTFGLPVMLAHSRKNFIGSVNGRPPEDRDGETHAVSALAYAQGVRVFRVHDVGGARRALDIARAVADGAPGDFAPGPGSWPWRAGASASHMTAAEADKLAPPGQRW